MSNEQKSPLHPCTPAVGFHPERVKLQVSQVATVPTQLKQLDIFL